MCSKEERRLLVNINQVELRIIMGCCETRNKQFSVESQKNRLIVDNLITNEDRIKIKQYKDLELLVFYLDLLHKVDEWQEQVKRDDVVINSIDKTFFTDIVPAVVGSVLLELSGLQKEVLEFIENDREWDGSCESYEVVELDKYFKRVKMVKRFGIERRVFWVKVMKCEENGFCSLICFNSLKGGEDDGDLQKGWYHFSITRVKAVDDKVFVSHMEQVDGLYEKSNYLSYSLGNKLFDWLTKLKFALESKFNKNDKLRESLGNNA